MGITERKEREKEQRRNDIIDAAEKVFFNKGFDNATMEEIAEQAELSKGTIYLYFKSKDELLFAIDLRAMKILMSLFRESVNRDKSTIDNLLEIGRAYVRFSREYEHYFRALLHFEGGESFNMSHVSCEQINFHEEDPMNFLIEMLEKGVKEGSIRTDIAPGILAHCLWSQTTGILKLTKIKDLHCDLNNHSEDEIINAHLEIIYHGILKNS